MISPKAARNPASRYGNSGGVSGGICIQNPIEQRGGVVAGRGGRVGLAEWREREQDWGYPVVLIGGIMTDSTTKICKMCFMAIPVEAKKCPHCLHFQSRLNGIIFHPATVALAILIPMLVVPYSFSRMLSKGEDFLPYSGQVQITESRIGFGESTNAATVAIIGTIKNSSPIPWKDILFQVDFQDANGQLVDAGQKAPYLYFLPAGDSLSFKVSFRREFPETNYVHHTIRVVSAKDGRAMW